MSTLWLITSAWMLVAALVAGVTLFLCHCAHAADEVAARFHASARL